MVDIKFDKDTDANDDKNHSQREENKNLEDMAMEELSSIPPTLSSEEDDEEFGDVDLDDDEIDFSIGEDEEDKEKVPKSPNECKLSALFDYLFFFYFMGLALMYKELRNKGKFVNGFIEKNKQIINDIKIRIERCLANSLPQTYEKLIKFEDYAFILGILMLSINFHIEVQDAITQQSLQEPVNNFKNVKNESKVQNNSNIKKRTKVESSSAESNVDIKSDTKEVSYNEQW